MHQLPARFQTSAACLLSWQLLFMHVSAAWFFATAAAWLYAFILLPEASYLWCFNSRRVICTRLKKYRFAL